MKSNLTPLATLVLFFTLSTSFAQELASKNLVATASEKSENNLKNSADLSEINAKSIPSLTKLDTLEKSKGVIVEEGYIEKMDDYLALRLSYTNDVERFFIKQETIPVEIFPNTETKTRLNLNYRFLSLGVNFIPKFLPGNDDELEKGKTKSFGLNLELNFSHWVQQLSYSKTTGYYLNNTGDYNPAWKPGDPFVQFPQLQYKNFQGLTGYNFNSKFSTKALLTGTERQLKSAGSFFPYVLYRYYLVDNKEEIKPGGSTQKSNNFEAILSAAYFYTYVFNEKFYASGGAAAGYGFISSKIVTRYFDDQIDFKQTNGIFRYDLRGALGYNSERLFGGLVVTSENTLFEPKGTSVINSNQKIFSQFFVGFRFNAPKKLRRTLDAVPLVN